MNEIYLKLKKDIQALTIAGVHLDKKFETKINKLIESVDIKEAKEVLGEINDAITTLDNKFKELEKIIADNKSLPEDVNELKTKVSTLEMIVKNNSGDITDLDSKISQNTGDIIKINGNITSIKQDINSLQIESASSIANIKNINENSIPNLQTQINVNKSDIKSLENNIQGTHEETEMIFLDIYRKLGQTDRTLFDTVEGVGIKSHSNNIIINHVVLEDPAIFDGITSILYYLSGSFTINNNSSTTIDLTDILTNDLEFYCICGDSITLTTKFKLTSVIVNSYSLTGNYYCEFLTSNHVGPISIYFGSSKSYSNDISWKGTFVLDRYGISNSQ